MATRFLTEADRAALDEWPPEIDHGDLAAHFTLSIDDVRWIRQRRQPGTRLAIGVSIGALSWLGHLPDPTQAPPSVVGRVAATVGVDAGAIVGYVLTVGVRVRQADAAAVVAHAGWRLCGRSEWKALGDSLTARAMEHDDPSVLFGLARDHLRAERVVRPGLDRLQRAVATARRRATAEVYLRCRPFLTDTLAAALDGLCEQDPGLGVAPIVWIGSGATSAAPEAIKTEIAKLSRLNEVSLPADLGGAIAPERQRHLARIARRSSPAALRRLEPIERYPTLLAWMLVATSQVIDEIVNQYDLALAGTDHRVRHLVAEQRSQLAAADLEGPVLPKLSRGAR